MSYWVEADIEIVERGKFSLKEACKPILRRFGGDVKRSQTNPNMYHLNYPSDGVDEAARLQDICKEAKKFKGKVIITITSLLIY